MSPRLVFEWVTIRRVWVHVASVHKPIWCWKTLNATYPFHVRYSLWGIYLISMLIQNASSHILTFKTCLLNCTPILVRKGCLCVFSLHCVNTVYNIISICEVSIGTDVEKTYWSASIIQRIGHFLFVIIYVERYFYDF